MIGIITMNLESNLLLTGILAALSLMGCSYFLWQNPRARISLICLLVFGGLFGAGAYRVLTSTPGGVDVIDEDAGDDLFPPIVSDDELNSLKDSWDSEAVANWPAASLLSKLSDIAYRPPVLASDEFRDMGFDQVVPVSSATMFGYVVSGHEVAVIAFRGSENEVGDWWTNLSRSPFPLDAGDVHEGFWMGYQSLKSQIETALAKARPKYVWITGHSLGGALAVCCAYDSDLSGQSIQGVITFGQPMVARQPLADDIDDQLLGRYARFVNRSDIVARIPPSYRPAGSLVWFTDRGIKRSKPKRKMFGAPMSGEHNLKSVDSEFDEPAPLSEADYQQWLADQSAPPVARNKDGEILLQGNSPYISNHSMDLYINEVESLVRGSSKQNSLDDLFGE